MGLCVNLRVVIIVTLTSHERFSTTDLPQKTGPNDESDCGLVMAGFMIRNLFSPELIINEIREVEMLLS